MNDFSELKTNMNSFVMYYVGYLKFLIVFDIHEVSRGTISSLFRSWSTTILTNVNIKIIITNLSVH
jgi:hypothetical protein